MIVSMKLREEVSLNGFAIIKGVLSSSECELLKSALGKAAGAGIRDIFKVQSVAEVAAGCLSDVVAPFLNAKPEPVRGIYFDKSPEVNWLVPWHQDMTLAVHARRDIPGFGPWSVKEGVHHVQPPVALLEQMITARLHLDDADVGNGALRVLPGSHLHGRLNAQQILRLRQTQKEVICRARVGDVLLMRPLLLHPSGRSSTDAHRRVIHVEYASFQLPQSLKWQEALALH